METLEVVDGVKQYRSDEFNYNFNLTTGFFQRWGKTVNDDPVCAPTAEIADIEIVTNGCPRGKASGKFCSFCYKDNTSAKASYMDFDTFVAILSKFPKINGHYFLSQIALGISSVAANPHLLAIMRYIRFCGIVPNVTISGRDGDIPDWEINELVSLVGAAAFSVYKEDKDQCYDLIARFIKAGLKQCNIHFLVCEESEEFAYELLKDIKTDSRLIGLQAIVFLALKPKNRGKALHVLPYDRYAKLINYCIDNDISFGADSCSCGKIQKVIKECSGFQTHQKEYIISLTDKCESCLNSWYINKDGLAFPCSFAEDIEQSIYMLDINDFNTEVWNCDKTKNWRTRLLALDRECPLYPEIRCHNE